MRRAIAVGIATVAIAFAMFAYLKLVPYYQSPTRGTSVEKAAEPPGAAERKRALVRQAIEELAKSDNKTARARARQMLEELEAKEKAETAEDEK
jgi:hypothetical protein